MEALEEKPITASDPVEGLPFEQKFEYWESHPLGLMKVKDPKATAYVLDQLFWNTEGHHKSQAFYKQLEGFIKNCIVKYGCGEEQQRDEDLPKQCYNKVLEAIDSYFNPYQANVVTFLHKVLFNQIKLRAYHANKYKDGSFYNKFHTYNSIIQSIVRNITTTDRITLDNFFDHLKFMNFNNNMKDFLKGDLIRIAPKDNPLFKAVIWELFQSDEDINIGKHNHIFNARADRESIEQRRSKVRRLYNIS